MADELTEKLGKLLQEKPWYQLPRLLADARLVEMRNELREKNLYDTEEPAEPRQEIPANLDPALRAGRTIDGTYNDLHFPKMGAAGRRFGRNFPLEHTSPDTANLLVPNPRVVSRELMTRDSFKPATILNLLAGAWLQFMVHDWFVHPRSTTDFIDVPAAPQDDFGEPSVHVPRTVADAAPAGSKRPPAYTNLNSHWWDASQIYGSDAATARKLRTKIGGKLRLEPTGLLPTDPDTGLSFTGFNDNWWIGLAMLHTLFTAEHNYLCDLLAHQHQDWDDDRLFTQARLINSAMIAKIHTVEWTPAIIPHPTIKRAMSVNWSGLAGEELQDVLKFLDDQELAGGIVGSKADHHSAPYSLTEEFVAVYRMHPLIPDEIDFNSLVTGRLLEKQPFAELAGRKTPAITERVGMPDLFYSFGVCHPGAVTLHNYPRVLQNLRRDDGEHLDLASVDILRDRERGVPRYNQFRRLIHKGPVKSFDELTENVEWRKQIKAVYDNDLERVDLMTGLYAEPLPEGFGFSETAFRVFLLMASRRLKSDRFFTDDFRAEVYTEFGLDFIRKNSMLSILQRHYPQLAPPLTGVENAFQPWKVTQGPSV
jgi:hypothetical protein